MECGNCISKCLKLSPSYSLIMRTWQAHHSTAHCSAVQCSTAHYSAVQYSTLQYSAVQCSTVEHTTVQCSAVQWSTQINYQQLSTTIIPSYASIEFSMTHVCTIVLISVRFATTVIFLLGRINKNKNFYFQRVWRFKRKNIQDCNSRTRVRTPAFIVWRLRQLCSTD